VEAKGRTFFAHELMLDKPLTSDGFINDILEHLRQNARTGIARGDEQQIEQTLPAMAQPVEVYLRIEYASRHASKTHAHLAAGYLSGEVERIVPHNMPDVLMKGVRLMGQCRCSRWLKQEITARLGAGELPDKDLGDRAARSDGKT